MDMPSQRAESAGGGAAYNPVRDTESSAASKSMKQILLRKIILTFILTSKSAAELSLSTTSDNLLQR